MQNQIYKYSPISTIFTSPRLSTAEDNQIKSEDVLQR